MNEKEQKRKKQGKKLKTEQERVTEWHLQWIKIFKVACVCGTSVAVGFVCEEEQEEKKNRTEKKPTKFSSFIYTLVKCTHNERPMKNSGSLFVVRALSEQDS